MKEEDSYIDEEQENPKLSTPKKHSEDCSSLQKLPNAAQATYPRENRAPNARKKDTKS